ncbi:MAG: hypothetical protein K2N25_05525 [Muribaculaceae bacterium]|nr:hypothetical protein [Muribaculaceae bacterium]
MNADKYYWSNRASTHHIERLRDFLPEGSDPERILHSGNPRYIEHIEENLGSTDGHRRYDFLIEYDIYHPSHGIYFGCRSTSLPGFDHSVETKVALKEWNKVLPLAIRRLNNVFPDKDFSCRLRDTDNDNDRTFWPFWISLHEDESPHDVARVALRILAAAYRDYMADNRIVKEMPEKKVITYPAVRTAFTEDAYDAFLRRFVANVAVNSGADKLEANKQISVSMLEVFLRGLEDRGVASRSMAYECAWCLGPEISDIEFSALIKTFFHLLTLRLGLGSQVKAPWQHIIRIFLRHDETPFKEQIKTLSAQQDTIDKMSLLLSDILK